MTLVHSKLACLSLSSFFRKFKYSQVRSNPILEEFLSRAPVLALRANIGPDLKGLLWTNTLAYVASHRETKKVRALCRSSLIFVSKA
jgi:hypothetical protein